MAAEKPEIDPKTIDRRVAARMLRKGLLGERDLEKALKTLPDSADKGVVIDAMIDDPTED